MDESFKLLNTHEDLINAKKASLDIPKHFIHQIKTPLFKPAYEQRVKTILEKHGCQLEVTKEHCVITFPQGTMSEQLWGNAICDRDKITLPDGYELLAMAIPNSTLSNPGFPPEDFVDIHL